MQVQCKINKINDIANTRIRNRLAESIHQENDADLVIAKIYPVIALDQWHDGGIRVYLHTVEENDYPYPYPLEMFEVIDASVPPNWSIKFDHQQDNIKVKQLSFPEWNAETNFYEKLIDGDETAIATYKMRRFNI